MVFINRRNTAIGTLNASHNGANGVSVRRMELTLNKSINVASRLDLRTACSGPLLRR